jgi:hypothetical protein
VDVAITGCGGLVEFVSPAAAQNVVEGHEIPMKPSAPVELAVHVVPPSVVATEERTPSTPTQTVVVGHEISMSDSTGPPVSLSKGKGSTVQVAPPSLVFMTSAAPVASWAGTKHTVVDGHETAAKLFIPAGAVSVVQLEPPSVVATMELLGVRPRVPTAMQSAALAHETASGATDPAAYVCSICHEPGAPADAEGDDVAKTGATNAAAIMKTVLVTRRRRPNMTPPPLDWLRVTLHRSSTKLTEAVVAAAQTPAARQSIQMVRKRAQFCTVTVMPGLVAVVPPTSVATLWSV